MIVIHMLLNIKFVLASNSASRKMLLKNAGLSFFIEKPLCDEDYIKKAVDSSNEFDQNSKKKNFNLDNYRQTKITFDKGGIWKNVKAPETDS